MLTHKTILAVIDEDLVSQVAASKRLYRGHRRNLAEHIRNEVSSVTETFMYNLAHEQILVGGKVRRAIVYDVAKALGVKLPAMDGWGTERQRYDFIRFDDPAASELYRRTWDAVERRIFQGLRR